MTVTGNSLYSPINHLLYHEHSRSQTNRPWDQNLPATMEGPEDLELQQVVGNASATHSPYLLRHAVGHACLHQAH